MLVHYLSVVITSLLIIFYPLANKFLTNILNSNYLLKITSILIVILLILKNYLLGILASVLFLIILDTNSKEINESFLDYYDKK